MELNTSIWRFLNPHRKMSKIPKTEAGKEKKQKKKSGMEWIAV